MSNFLKQSLILELRRKVVSRSLSCTAILSTKDWRVKQGLCINKNAEGPLTDAPDYTFLDGRPTPLLHKQKKRILKQRGFAEKIVELHGELDFAIEREKRMMREEAEQRQRILDNRLKPKGATLFKKS